MNKTFVTIIGFLCVFSLFFYLYLSNDYETNMDKQRIGYATEYAQLSKRKNLDSLLLDDICLRMEAMIANTTDSIHKAQLDSLYHIILVNQF